MATAEMPTVAEPAINEDALYEVIDGKVAEKHVGVFESWLASRLGFRLEAFVEANGLGRTIVQALFRTKKTVNQKRRPDVAYLSRERWPLDQPAPEGEAFDVAPDLAVEVVSPTDRASELQAKIQEYFEAGVRAVWVVYGATAMIEVRDSATSARVFRRGDILDGGAVVPGFQLAVADLLPESKDSRDSHKD